MFKKATLTQQEQYETDVMTVAFMNAAPFYAHLMYSIGELVATRDLPTAATDGKRVYFNPDYALKLKVSERVFLLAHEMTHLVNRHPSRFRHYAKAGELRSKPWSDEFANICADLVINAELVETKIGSCNPSWLFDLSVKGDELWEDVYERLAPPPQSQQAHGCDEQAVAGGLGGASPPSTYGSSGRALRGQQGDKQADAKGGRFDVVLEPGKDPATGAEDLPDEAEFNEAVVRAHAAAKAMGKVPASVERLVAELLSPKVDWRDHIRLLMTGHLGQRRETWTRPNRRRLVLTPLVITPGRRSWGCELVVVAVDTSGSIGARDLAAFFAEISGILSDCRPKRIIVISCDAAVAQVDELSTPEELMDLAQKGIKGGGGTDFRPVFDYVAERDLRPDTLVYLTDLYGRFPDEAPLYPVIWTATTNENPPWGETVRIEIGEG